MLHKDSLNDDERHPRINALVKCEDDINKLTFPRIMLYGYGGGGDSKSLSPC